MTRKTKIGIVVAVAVLGAVAAILWPGEDQGKVRIMFTGVAPQSSNLVFFTITNRSAQPLICGCRAQEYTAGAWVDLDGPLDAPRLLEGRSAMSWPKAVPSVPRWRIQAAWHEPMQNSFLVRIRKRLGQYALKHQWLRVGRWVWPSEKWHYASGPIMLGNQPAPPEQK